MNCLKCGREIEEGQVFCNDCLVQMAKYPVKPGTSGSASVPWECGRCKEGSRPPPGQDCTGGTAEGAEGSRPCPVCAACCLCGAAVVLSVVTLRYMSTNRLLPGQNYSAVTATTPTEES